MATGRLQCATPQISTTWCELFSHFTNILILIIVFCHCRRKCWNRRFWETSRTTTMCMWAGFHPGIWPNSRSVIWCVGQLAFFSKCLRLLCFDFQKSRSLQRIVFLFNQSLVDSRSSCDAPMEAASFNRMKISSNLQYFSQGPRCASWLESCIKH